MEWKLEVVIVPVGDVERAKRFYSEQLGFIIDHDTQIDANYRAVQLTPPGPACSMVISTDNHNMIAGSIKGLLLVVADIEIARVGLLQQGVEVSPIKHYEGTKVVESRGGDWNSFIFFSDPDGNEWVIKERPSPR